MLWKLNLVKIQKKTKKIKQNLAKKKFDLGFSDNSQEKIKSKWVFRIKSQK